MSGIRSLFDSITLDTIRGYVDRREQEHLHIEFKTLADPPFQRDDRRNLAQAISGFSNADGGLIVWGVDARRDRTGADVATELRPVSNLARARSEIETLTGEATNPAVLSVEHRSIDEANQSGFLVTFVPASDGGPHMAKLGEDRYYRRSGSSFRRMEHFEIEDMFGRRPRSCLSFCTRVTLGSRTAGSQGPAYEVYIVAAIRNTGRGLARFPSLQLEVAEPWVISSGGLDGNRRNGLPRAPIARGSQRRSLYTGGADHVVHIDSELEVTRIACGRPFVEACNPPSPLTIEYRIAAEGISPIEGDHVVDSAEITQAIEAAGGA